MPEPYVAVHIDEVPYGPDRGRGVARLLPVRRHLGIEAFGANARVAHAAGDVLVMPHDERANGPYGTDGHEELYVVLQGRATFTLDGEEVDAPAGTLVYVKPATRRGAVAREDGTTVIGFGAPIGKAFEVSKWEAAFAAYGYQRLGNPERAIATMHAGWESDPDHWASNYHYACLLALQGRGDEALEKLARAVELNEQAAEWAAGDEDFASIRDDPRFASA